MRRDVFPTAGVNSQTFRDLEEWGWDLTAELLSQHGERHLRKLNQLAQEGVRSKNVLEHSGLPVMVTTQETGNLKRTLEGQRGVREGLL